MSTSCQLKFSRRATDLRLVPELITNQARNAHERAL